MLSLPQAVEQVNHDAAKFLDPDLIEADCAAFGYFFRRRRLAPTTLLLHFLRQVLAGNTACNAVRQMGGATFSAAAYCLARQRMPLEVIQSLLLRLAEFAPNGDAGDE